MEHKTERDQRFRRNFLLLFLSTLAVLLILGVCYGNQIGIDRDAVTAEDEIELHFSQDSGFYQEGFDLTLDAGMGMTVYYTTDGTDPTTQSQVYAGPIRIEDPSANENVYSTNEDLCPYVSYRILSGQKPVYKGWYLRYRKPEGLVDKCAVIRAIAVDEHGVVRAAETKTYFVGYDRKEGYDKLPILSIVTDPKGLFSEETGIMVNGAEYNRKLKSGEYRKYITLLEVRKDTNTYGGQGKAWERKAHIDYYDVGGSKHLLTQDVGIRLHGNQTRVNTNFKSFNLYARKEYDGNKKILYPFFENGILYDSVTLMRGTSIRNYYLAGKMRDRGMAAQSYQLVQVFLDGEYWGMYAIQERVNSKQYMKAHYGKDDDEYILMTGDRNKLVAKRGNQKTGEKSYQELISFIQSNNMKDPEVYAEVESRMDIQSFIDFYATKLYLGDIDWSWKKNLYLAYYDGKWHWILYDMDYTTGSWQGTEAEINSFGKTRMNGVDKLKNDAFFPYLAKNKTFRNQFMNTFLDLANEIYNGDKIKEELTSFKEDLWETAMKSVARYPAADETAEYSRKHHHSYITDTCDQIIRFFEKRADYAPKYARGYFGIYDSLKKVKIVNKTPEGGKMKINTITPELDEKNKWKGKYYPSFPVKVEATAEDGWVFTGFTSDKGTIRKLSETSAEVSFTDDITIEAHFKKIR